MGGEGKSESGKRFVRNASSDHLKNQGSVKRGCPHTGAIIDQRGGGEWTLCRFTIGGGEERSGRGGGLLLMSGGVWEERSNQDKTRNLRGRTKLLGKRCIFFLSGDCLSSLLSEVGRDSASNSKEIRLCISRSSEKGGNLPFRKLGLKRQTPPTFKAKEKGRGPLFMGEDRPKPALGEKGRQGRKNSRVHFWEGGISNRKVGKRIALLRGERSEVGDFFMSKRISWGGAFRLGKVYYTGEKRGGGESGRNSHFREGDADSPKRSKVGLGGERGKGALFWEISRQGRYSNLD